MATRIQARSKTRGVAQPSATSERGTLREWLDFLGARPEPTWVPFWPPDAFALGAALLRRTGAYVGMVNGAHSRRSGRTDGSREAVQAGQEWRKRLELAL